jgi:hypothetical protein
MPCELRWLVSTAASSMHAAAALARGDTLVDRAACEALSEPTRELLEVVEAMGWQPARFFEHAVPQSARFDVPRELAKVLSAKLVGFAPAGPPEQLASRLGALQRAFDQAHPRALEDLELRAAPLMEQWEARGPGLLADVGRRTEPELLVESADVILVHPVLGGGGAAHWLYNSVRIEAVLANPDPALPEVLRLGWLLAQLQLDVPRYHDNLHRDQLEAVGALAMIPPVLAAAQEVELARHDQPTLAAALAAWPRRAPAEVEATAQTLFHWWETYESTSPTWAVALGALAEMVKGQDAPGDSDAPTEAPADARQPPSDEPPEA